MWQTFLEEVTEFYVNNKKSMMYKCIAIEIVLNFLYKINRGCLDLAAG